MLRSKGVCRGSDSRCMKFASHIFHLVRNHQLLAEVAGIARKKYSNLEF